MRRWAFGLVLVLAAPAAGQDTAEAVIKKAVDAHGGADALKKQVAGTFALKGTIVLSGMEVPFTGTGAYQIPGRFRQELQIEAGGMKVPLTVVVNGDKVTQTVNGQPTPLPEAARNETRQAALSQEITQLVPLLDASRFTIKAGKDADVNGMPAAAVVVTGKGLNDTTAYFDKKTGYLVKTSRKALSPEGQGEVTEDTVVSDFAKVNGIVAPKKIVVTHNGKPFLTAAVSDYKFSEKLDPKTFDTPKD